MDVTERLNAILSLLNIVKDNYDILANSNSDIYARSELYIKYIIDSNDLFANSYAIIESDLFNMLPIERKYFDLDSFDSMRDDYVFYLRLENESNTHEIVIISNYSSEFRYIIIFPCINKIRYVKTKSDLINDYVKAKTRQGFKFSGTYGKYIYPNLLDVYYLFENIILNNIRAQDIPAAKDAIARACEFFLTNIPTNKTD